MESRAVWSIGHEPAFDGTWAWVDDGMVGRRARHVLKWGFRNSYPSLYESVGQIGQVASKSGESELVMRHR